VRLRIGALLAGVLMLLAAGCGAADRQPPGPAPILVPTKPDHVLPGPAFPRTAVYFLEHENLPDARTLARYDVVVLDSEWAHREPKDFFTKIRALNPDIVLLAYVNLVDLPPELGSRDRWADRYRLWKFDTDVRSEFPPQWLARTSGGTVLSEWPQTSMTNLTDQAPRVNGQTYAEYAADWVADTVWPAGVWNGIFLDVWGDRIYGASRSRWDINGDGTDERDTEIYGPGKPWERGIDAAERRMRARMPSAILVANGDRTLRRQQLDGRVWESFADSEAGREPGDDLSSYVTSVAQGAHRLPGLAMTISKQRVDPGSEEDLRRGRFFLTATLLQNGYWAAMGPDYGRLAEYDELDGGGLGPGYLGRPLLADPTPAQVQGRYANGVGGVADGVFRRDFERGIALNNISDDERTVTLERPYRHLSGKLDPLVNDGSITQTVTIPAHDGLVLLRTG
jgi:hypothetical protein